MEYNIAVASVHAEVMHPKGTGRMKVMTMNTMQRHVLLAGLIVSSCLPGLTALGVTTQSRSAGFLSREHPTHDPASPEKHQSITVKDVREARDMWIKVVERLSVPETVTLYDIWTDNNATLLDTVDDHRVNIPPSYWCYGP